MQGNKIKDVIIIGAGQAGLALGYYLKKQGADFVILDGASGVGESWQKRWDSLELFTARRYCALPGLSFPGAQNGHPNKQEVADYLKVYAEHFELPVILNSRVEKLQKRGDIFAVSTKDREYTAGSAVLATGPFQAPRVPEFAQKIKAFQLHSSQYKNPGGLPPGKVLVVGCGNSGAQIAYELAQAGREVILSARRKPRFIPKYILGLSISFWVESLGLVKLPADSFLGKKASAGGRPFVVGTELRPLIKTGKVKLMPQAMGVQGEHIKLSDNTTIPVSETVIWASGYKFDYSWLDVPGALTGAGEPVHKNGISTAPGLYFLGLDWQRIAGSGFLDGISYDAKFIAEQIKKS